MAIINLPVLVKLFPMNTQVITITGLQDIVSGLYLDAATVTATLFDQYGNPDPILNEVVMAYLPGSNGNYQGTVPATFNPALGDGYTLQILADQANVQSLFSIPAKVQLRSQQ
jgi:hypothetical protein